MTRAFRWIAPLVLAAATARASLAARAIKVETGRFEDLVERLASREFVLGEPDRDPRPYVDPTPALHEFRHLAATLAWGDVRDAAATAAQLDYELVKFVDARTARVYYVLREDLSRLPALRGWGSYIFNPESRVDALIEAPHPLADAQTPEIGGAVFERSGARGFLLAGAHRDKADVPDLVDSIFHQVHMAWVGPAAHVATWQIHGFTSAKHSFPAQTHVVASTGDGAVAPGVESLDQICEKRGFASYVFNDTPPQSTDNQRLNGGVPGVAFVSLAATANEQGRYSRSLGGSFVHVELENEVRTDSAQRRKVVGVIAAAMLQTSHEEAAVASAADQPAMRLASYHAVQPANAPASAAADEPPATGNVAPVVVGVVSAAAPGIAAIDDDFATVVPPTEADRSVNDKHDAHVARLPADGARTRR